MALILRNLFWTLLCPGTVALALPWYISSGFRLNTSGWQWPQWMGLIVLATGIGLLLWCIYAFGRYGRGTLSPLDPARYLVVQGLYRYVRNPMYLGVLTILAGESLFCFSATLLCYTAIVFIVFNAFIQFYEEPRLRKQFGEEYIRYCSRVKRWIPGKPYT